MHSHTTKASKNQASELFLRLIEIFDMQGLVQIGRAFKHIPMPVVSLLEQTLLRTVSSSVLAHQSTVNASEAKKFADLAAHWWDLQGPFKPLHQMNPTRCKFIRESLIDHFQLDNSTITPLSSLKILDVGCGGGLLSESLGRMGACVLGIDVNEDGLRVARAHTTADSALSSRIEYKLSTVEKLVEEKPGWYDAVIASEVIEHVDDMEKFCQSLAALAKPGGAVIVSTLNRTLRSYLLAIVAAEKVLKWTPEGTHDWSNFVTPEELTALLRHSNMHVEQMAGMVFNPLLGVWDLHSDTGVNYIALFGKPKS